MEDAPTLSKKEAARNAIACAPLTKENHFAFAEACEAAAEFELAFAAYRTAAAIGGNDQKIDEKVQHLAEKLPRLETLVHNQYFRFSTLQKELLQLEPSGKFSMIDVGGGIGRLSQFLPEADYCLAEPSVNAISGSQLPFVDNSFDYVVSCHVLEHIPLVERDQFLDELARPARKAVILLNPFEVPGTFIEERLHLFYELIDAEWALEHLECTLPKLEDLETWAGSRGYQINIQPNGTLTTSAAMVFVEHYARIAEKTEDLARINQFFNSRMGPIIDSERIPNAYLATIKLS